jgi:hypothetical protein
LKCDTLVVLRYLKYFAGISKYIRGLLYFSTETAKIIQNICETLQNTSKQFKIPRFPVLEISNLGLGPYWDPWGSMGLTQSKGKGSSLGIQKCRTLCI